MEKRMPERDEKKWNILKNQAERAGGLVGALAAYACQHGSNNRLMPLWRELEKLWGKEPAQLSREEFLSPELVGAFAALAGRELADKLPGIVALRMEGQFSNDIHRRSYRSGEFGVYLGPVLYLLGALIRISCHKETTKERLCCGDEYGSQFCYLLAWELRQGNEEIIALVREALLGENTRIPLSRTVIEAVIISGHEALLDDLMKLLVAARLQEGLRQSILESADMGSLQVLARVLKVCLQEDLFRYSATIRAFDVWTGLGYGDTRPAAIHKYAQLAYDCLTDQEKCRACSESESNTEAYFALWAQGCREFRTVWRELVPKLLRDDQHYRKILGWMFVSQVGDARYQMDMACQYLQERDAEVLAWIVQNLAWSQELRSFAWSLRKATPGQKMPDIRLPPDRETRKRVFDQLRELAAFIGDKKRVFTGNPFDFVSVTLDNERVYDCLMSLAAFDMEEELVDAVLTMAPAMNADQRRCVIRVFLMPDRNRRHRDFLLDCLNDRSPQVKVLAVERLQECSLCREELEALIRSLRSRSSSLRAAVMAVLRKQPLRLLRPLLPGMLRSPEENQVQAAIELICEYREELLPENRAHLEALGAGRLSTQTEILRKPLLEGERTEAVFTAENGYGLYDPRVVRDYLAGLEGVEKRPGLLARVFGTGGALLSAAQLKGMLPTREAVEQLLSRMNQVFIRHADAEIEVLRFGGSREKVLFGDTTHHIPLPAETGCFSLGDGKARLEMIPFWEEFREALGEYARDVDKMLGLFHVMAPVSWPGMSYNQARHCPWFLPIAALGLTPELQIGGIEIYNARFGGLLSILQHLPTLFSSREVFPRALLCYRSMAAVIGWNNLGRAYRQLPENPMIPSFAQDHAVGINHRMLVTWRYVLQQLKLDSREFALWFPLEYRMERNVECDIVNRLRMEDYLRAYQEQCIPRDVLMEHLLTCGQLTRYEVGTLTDRARSRDLYERYPFLRELAAQLIERIVTVEEGRGELPTPLTRHCLAIERLEGARHFCRLLAALGKESFFRGYHYSFDTGKKAVLSGLLKRCWPAPEDTPEGLAAMLKATDISEKRLAEAVMYAPQWAGFAERILGWPGLKCGVWFFHAHINESFSAEKETEVAIFSPVSPQQFNDGAFDKNWFFEAYGQLGEKRFQILYRAAKYITSGSNQHRRSQLYADAVLGRLDAGALMREITEKRNQEKLRCYPLIPIAPGDTQEALRRYEFIQKFLKESKQFGALRRDSEKKACATALENLAITTGLMDVNRLMWQMESQKLEELRPLMEPVLLDGVSLRLTIDDRGEPGIAVEKEGKALKTPPKSLAKNRVWLELKSTVKELKDVKRRSRESMERAMMEGTLFGVRELRNISGNPILAPMLHSLVWTDDSHNGFLEKADGNLVLVDLEGKRIRADRLRIAHPHDLKIAGRWTDFMSLVYERQLVQPFKQVFREYYPLTDDERQERTRSRRYAGHQVQPQRTAALLKSRGWTVDYEEGLQKVFYKEELIVRLVAVADWFSPADIEAPTLEMVEFFHRRTGENVPLTDIPPVLFSEVMRDLDMVVGVAHVGGVDPEASHSTTEMRLAIAGELMRLLGISNVSWVGSHARIRGSLANYSVHMGSGVVHAEGVGMLTILPVHSQARGRIFLPFADDDPKTAEIMSKLLLLAEDRKLKDPTILSQLS